jgi:hypothetical protein
MYRLEKTTAGQDIVISGWEQGISDNPYQGLGDMRNVDNVTIPGEVSVALSTEAMITQDSVTNAVFTVDASSVGVPTVASTTESGFATSTTHTTNKPSGLAVGDIMLGYVFFPSGSVGVTPPAGWSTIGFSTIQVGVGAGFYYYKIADAGDVAATDFTVTFDVSGQGYFAIMRITGGDTDFSTWKYGGNDRVANATADPSIGPGITPDADSLIIQLWTEAFTGSTAISDYAIANDDPTWTQAFQDDSAGVGGVYVAAAYGLRASSSATGNQSVVGGAGTTYWAAGIISIPPGGSSPIIIYSGTPALEVNTAITVSNSGGSLPSGLATNTVYYVREIISATEFTVSAISAGGTELNITSSGSGTNTFSTINMGTPKYFASGDAASPELASFFYLYFLVDSNGRCWVYATTFLGGSFQWVYMHNKSNESVSETGNGLVVYKGCLFWFSGTEINVINMTNLVIGVPTLAYLTTRDSWVDEWKTDLSNEGLSNVSHQAILAVNDDSVYFCNGKHVGSILTAISIGDVPPYREDGEVFNIANTHTIATGVTTDNSEIITTATDFFQETDVGAVIVGVGIPEGTYITSVTSATAATMSADATGTDTGVTFTITSGYVYNDEALAIPSNDMTNCLAELGTNLLVGGVNNCIYPWDRVSTGYGTVALCSENFIQRMVTVNTTTYIFCGYKGRMYQTNGSNVSDFWEAPEFTSNTTNPYILWTDAIFNRNQLYFGLQVFENDGDTINQYGGTWAINLATGAGKLQNKMSYNTYAGYVSALWIYRGDAPTDRPQDDGYGLFMGWNNGSVGGIDKGVSAPYTGGEAIVVSDMIPVGQYLTKWTGNNLEFKLATPLVTGESVALAYRSAITDSFTDVPITSGGAVGELSGIAKVNFEKVQWLQVRATLTSTLTNPSFVRLQEIRVR